MAAARTVLFSCEYGFNPIGVTEFLDRFKYGFDNPEHAPFVSYDAKTNMFSLALDRHDVTTAPYFLARLKYFINQHVQNPQIIDPRIRQFNELVARRSLGQEIDDNPGLLDIYDEDDGSDSGEEDALQAMQHLTACWYPKEGDIKILTTAVAENIASLTGCSIYPEPHENRARLVNGDFKLALKKLQNIEPLLMLQHQQRSFSTTRANANVLLETSNDPNPSMRFWRIADPSRPSFQRVIVDSRAAPYLHQKLVCENFFNVESEDGFEQFRMVPDNLQQQNISRTTTIRPSAIWDDYTYKVIGDESNKEPMAPSNLESKQQSDINPTMSTVGVNHYIEPTKAAQVAAWSGQVDEMVDPNSARPEPPAEPTTARRRLVAADSDSEEENDKPIQRPVPKIPRLAESAGIEHPQASQPRRGKGNDLISLGSTGPSSAAMPALPPQQDGTGMSVFQDGALERDLLDASTVASNLLKYQSEGSPPPYRPAQSKQACSHDNKGSNSSIFSVLNIDPEGESDEANDRRSQNAITTSKSPTSMPSSTAQQSNHGRFHNTSEHMSADDREILGSPKPKQKPTKIGTLDGAYSHKAANRPRHTPTSAGATSGSSAYNDGLPGGFDPTAYGLRTRRPTSSSRSTTHSISPVLHSTVSSSPRGRQNVGPPPPKRSSMFRGRGSQPQTQREKLVDLASSTVQSQALKPPPGLEIQIPESALPETDEIPIQSPEPPNLMDDPVEQPLVQPRPTSQERSDLISFSNGLGSYASGGSRSFASRAERDAWAGSSEYENHVPYRPNINARKAAALQKLMAMRGPSASGVETQGALPPRKAKNENLRCHSTMSQKAGNPKKKRGGKIKSETVEQARRRKQKTLDDAYGHPVTAKPRPRQNPPQDDIGHMSKAKQKLLNESPDMQSANSNVLKQVARLQSTDQIIGALSPIFEAGRAFNGQLQFELQLGRVMVTPNGQITADKTVSAKTWDKIVGISAKPNGPVTSFSKILTSNGADVDRALEFKGGPGSSKIWDKSISGKTQLTYEFHCQSKQGIDFWLVVNEDGDYVIRNMTTTVGMVAVHYPAQVWDAAAILQGQENWYDPPKAIVDAIAEFVSSIYVLPERRQLALIFRQPKNLEITVRNVVMKRVSLHQCRLINRHDLRLQITEVKTLSTKIHPADKRLWQAFEKDYKSMSQEGTVHYELSIVDKGVNEILARNVDLEVGELTSAISTGKALLRKDSIEMMLDAATHMLERSDWMGADNCGTLLRKAMAEQEQQARQHQSLPPTARSRMHQPVLPASKATSRFGGSMIGGGGAGGNDTFIGMTRIPGTRANTMAAVYEDAEGNYYAKGMGGAHVPVADSMLAGALGTIGEEVGPDDSASQYGMPRTPRVGTARRPDDGKGTGFW